MLRYITCLAATVFIGAPLWAGELDGEFGTKAPATATGKQVSKATPATAAVLATLAIDAGVGAKGSELDGETPTQAGRGYRGWGGWGRGWGHGWGRGWYGWGHHWHHGWRGYGWAGYGWRGYRYLPYFSYYPSYISYGYYGYPASGWCW